MFLVDIGKTRCLDNIGGLATSAISRNPKISNVFDISTEICSNSSVLKNTVYIVLKPEGLSNSQMEIKMATSWLKSIIFGISTWLFI